MSPSILTIQTGCQSLTAGMSLKPEYFDQAISTKSLGLWYEVHIENYFMQAGPRRQFLNTISETHPISFHGVGASLGGSKIPDLQHLKKVKHLIDEINPVLVSEHASWSQHQNTYFADLLPLPKTKQAMQQLIDGVDAYQNAIGRTISIENPSNYLPFISEMDEPQFLAEVAQRTGCGLLVDVTNIYISHINTGIDITGYLNALPAEKVTEIHVAGFEEDDNFGSQLLIDSHGSPVPDKIWNLLSQALEKISAPILIERDTNIPSFDELIGEREKAHQILTNAHINSPQNSSQLINKLFNPMPDIDINNIRLTDYFDAFAEFLKDGKLDELTQFISPESREISRSYLQIYRNGFLKTSIDALRNNYSTISVLLPEDQFSLIARRYIDLHPPNTGTLTGYGKHFSDFLAEQSAFISDNEKWIVDLAKLDYAWLSSLYARKSASLTAERVQQLSEQNIDVANVNIRLNQCCRLVPIQYAVFELWQQQKINTHKQASINSSAHIAVTNSVILFWKNNDQVIARKLDNDEQTFLQMVNSSQSIGDIAELTLEKHPTADIATIFSNLLTHEILIEVKKNEHDS